MTSNRTKLEPSTIVRITAMTLLVAAVAYLAGRGHALKAVAVMFILVAAYASFRSDS